MQNFFYKKHIIMEIDLTYSKNEIDGLAENALTKFEKFLSELKPNDYKPHILLAMVFDENEKHLSNLYAYVYDNHPQSDDMFLGATRVYTKGTVSHIALLSHVSQIRKRFDSLQQKYLLSAFPDSL